MIATVKFCLKIFLTPLNIEIYVNIGSISESNSSLSHNDGIYDDGNAELKGIIKMKCH